MERLKRTEKNTLTERVLQFGEGNFLRGFVDWMIDKLNKENGGDYGVTIVQPLAGGLVDKTIQLVFKRTFKRRKG